MKVRYDGKQSIFSYEGPSGTQYVFVGNAFTEVTDEKDIETFRKKGGFTILEDDVLAKAEKIKELPSEDQAPKRKIKKVENK